MELQWKGHAEPVQTCYITETNIIEYDRVEQNRLKSLILWVFYNQTALQHSSWQSRPPPIICQTTRQSKHEEEAAAAEEEREAVATAVAIALTVVNIISPLTQRNYVVQ